MKRVLILSFLIIFLSSIVTHEKISKKHINYLPITIVVKKDDVKKIKANKVKRKIKPTVQFLKKLALFESNNNYKAIKGSGKYTYIGKYQINIETIRFIGYEVNVDSFKTNPDLHFNESMQNAVMMSLLKFNKKILNKRIKMYKGKEIKGVYLTTSGMLAAAHLGGAGSVINFIDSKGKKDFKDGNGIPISHYMKNFSDYKIDL